MLQEFEQYKTKALVILYNTGNNVQLIQNEQRYSPLESFVTQTDNQLKAYLHCTSLVMRQQHRMNCLGISRMICFCSTAAGCEGVVRSTGAKRSPQKPELLLTCVQVPTAPAFFLKHVVGYIKKGSIFAL